MITFTLAYFNNTENRTKNELVTSKMDNTKCNNIKYLDY